MSEQLMSPTEAERSIWGLYWQVDNMRDRSAPGPGMPTDSEIVQKKEEKATWLGLLGERLKKQVDRFYTTKKRQEYLDGEAARAKEEIRVRNELLPGRLDPRTGLPVNARDLATGRGVVSGIDLCLEVIIPPDLLAASCTHWLPPCPGDQKREDWEAEDSNWQALAYKPKAEWSEDEVATVRANGFMIKKAVHRLADEHQYFNLRPINDKDPEMHDLIWEDRAGFTLGFKLTYKGYQYMSEFCDKDPDLRRSIHLLTYAGKELRESAPEWAQREYQQANG